MTLRAPSNTRKESVSSAIPKVILLYNYYNYLFLLGFKLSFKLT
jgi:hypothetical protein